MADSFDAPRRAPTFPRQPEELHIPTANNSVSPSGGQRSGQPAPSSASEYTTGLPPPTNVHRSAPHGPQQSGQLPANSHASSNLPGALQPGNMNRPSALSSNAAPTAPTLPQLSTQQQQHPPQSATPSKGPQNRGYSRSSPAGFDQQQMYKAEDGKFMPPPSAGGGAAGPSSQTPQSTPFSPLGLADIRPLMDSTEDPTGAGPLGQLDNGGLAYPTNSNYLAPWGVYALDWCKWPTRPNSPSMGKVALGSYLEDHHNYV